MKFNKCLKNTSFLILLLVLFNHTLVSQSSEYTIESFQGEYNELASYQSIAILTQGDVTWEYEFQLNFPFPFYDSTYTRIFYDNPSWGYFTEDQDAGLQLMYFLAYAIENVEDTSNITSDVRFTHVAINNTNAFVIQFTNVRFFADPFADSLDTYLNYQIWLFENGIIEVHFGEMHMDNNPIYEPGKGFHTYSDEGVDTNFIEGPYMGISHPLNEENAIGFHGNISKYAVVGTPYAVLNELPPIGWVIRFKPTFVGIPNLIYKEMSINPNPAYDLIRTPFINEEFRILNEVGKELINGYLTKEDIDISNLLPGIYFLHVSSNQGNYIGKFVKK